MRPSPSGKGKSKDVYASVPCRLNNNGIAEVIELDLTEEELKKFAASCETMTANYKKALSL